MMINTSLKRQHKGNRDSNCFKWTFDLHQIEYGYTKMIMSAKIYICKALTLFQINRISMHLKWRESGVDVHLMIPCKPDHPFVYWATFSYAAELLNSGVKIYTYQNGFIHSKVMMIDDEICSVGSLIWIIVVSR